MATVPADKLRYVPYRNAEEDKYLTQIRQLIGRDLSEPYGIYVYRYFLHQWEDLCFMALHPTTDEVIGVVISKLEWHRSGTFRGYLAMLVTKQEYRGKGIAKKLVKLSIDMMKAQEADEIVLETEVTNTASLKLYENLGFLRSKCLHRYYLNGNTAYRLILYLKEGNAFKAPLRPPGAVEEQPDYII